MLPLPASPNTIPFGATLVPGGVTFRTWAPSAQAVYLLSEVNAMSVDERYRLTALGDGTWAGQLAGATVGHRYRFHVVGLGSTGPKRDPRARLLTTQPAFPDADCLVRDHAAFPWHDTGWRTPAFSDLVLYQLHVGTFRIPTGSFGGHFLDVALQVPYFAALGLTGLQLMPVVEFATPTSLGYNGTDYFSPENDYAVDDPAALADYLAQIDTLFAEKGLPGYGTVDAISSPDDQLRALIDLCHTWGLAVLFDVVYNHAGGFYGDDFSVYFFDRQTTDNQNNSLYFTEAGWAGGPVFAYWKNEVRQFLIDHTLACLHEYRIDGLRFDEVSVMDRYGGWGTCQAITDTARYVKPEAIAIAEYWPVKREVVSPTAARGAGFDATWSDGLREAIRGAIAQSAGGAGATVDLDRLAGAIASSALPSRWRAVNCIENHDIVKSGEGPRIARLADGGDSRSWYARSRSRVATGLLLTAPGIPQLFMGQEILEDKQWSDYPPAGLLVDWAALDGTDSTPRDFLRFTSELLALRRRQPALRGEPVNFFHVHRDNRVLAFHRWLEGVGRDVVIVVSLHESTWWDYALGFPGGGLWLELFNSDVYDHWVNPAAAGNGGRIEAAGGPLHGLPASAHLVIPANSILVFARNAGD